MRRQPLPVLILLVGLGLMIYAVAMAASVHPVLQYMALAPAPRAEGEASEEILTNKPLRALADELDELKEDLSEFVERMTISAMAPDTAFVSDENLQMTGTLYGVGEEYFAVYPRALLSGRLFYPEELKWGERACIIGETLAVKLFRTTEPLGRILTIGGVEYRVVGVLRAGSRVGTMSEVEVYVPMRQLSRGALKMETVMASAVPLKGAGAGAAFLKALESWAVGEMIDVEKETMRALLPVRILAFFLGMSVLLWGVGLWKGITSRRLAEIRAQLVDQYAKAVAPQMAILCAIGAVGMIALVGAGAALIWFVVQPVFTFTEWVPSVPVEWTEIAKTFWTVQTAAAKTISLRSEALLRARNLAACVNAGVAMIVGAWLWMRRGA